MKSFSYPSIIFLALSLLLASSGMCTQQQDEIILLKNSHSYPNSRVEKRFFNPRFGGIELNLEQLRLMNKNFKVKGKQEKERYQLAHKRLNHQYKK